MKADEQLYGGFCVSGIVIGYERASSRRQLPDPRADALLSLGASMFLEYALIGTVTKAWKENGSNVPQPIKQVQA